MRLIRLLLRAAPVVNPTPVVINTLLAIELRLHGDTVTDPSLPSATGNLLPLYPLELFIRTPYQHSELWLSARTA